MRFVLGIIAGVAAVMVAAPVYASHVYDDVASENVHHDAIDWGSAWGITQGCDDDSFCPSDAVTRAESMSFLYRYDQALGGEHEPQVEVVSGPSRADCPSDTVLVGGGFHAGSGSVAHSYPSGNSWYAGGGQSLVTAYAVCLR